MDHIKVERKYFIRLRRVPFTIIRMSKAMQALEFSVFGNVGRELNAFAANGSWAIAAFTDITAISAY
jgi:hypothetical protein